MNPIPLVHIEEHHEAFYVWHHAIRSGWMHAAGNVLAHIDEHHDLYAPILTRPLSAIDSLDSAAHFVYQQLGVGNFIWPGVWQGIFQRMYWMRWGRTKAPVNECWHIWPEDVRELRFNVSKAGPAECTTSFCRSLDLWNLGPRDPFEPGPQFVLDLDLDYFACNSKPKKPFELEITAAAFEEFRTNPYHLLRLPSDKITAHRDGGRFALRFNDYERAVLGEVVLQQSIDERLERFFERVDSWSHWPRLIVVCRSVFSGYTPSEWADYISSRIVAGLRSRMNIRCYGLADLIPPDFSFQHLVVQADEAECLRD